ncbi:hypothetical protein ADE_05890 [Achromobacter denitrificans]|nr:hypothetical protein ADE_05890 [Achromobacter denitrificans]
MVSKPTSVSSQVRAFMSLLSWGEKEECKARRRPRLAAAAGPKAAKRLECRPDSVHTPKEKPCSTRQFPRATSWRQ